MYQGCKYFRFSVRRKFFYKKRLRKILRKNLPIFVTPLACTNYTWAREKSDCFVRFEKNYWKRGPRLCEGKIFQYKIRLSDFVFHFFKMTEMTKKIDKNFLDNFVNTFGRIELVESNLSMNSL